MPSCAAISSSVGARASFASSWAIVRSISRGRAQARHPVHGAELVDDEAAQSAAIAYVLNDVAVDVEALDGADQAEQAVGDEGLPPPLRRQTAPQSAGDVLHERRVREDQTVAQGLRASRILGALELAT